METRKTYVAEITLGISTNTYDREGAIVQQKDPSYVTKAQIDELLPTFTGKILQKPPSFSALKFQGKRLYELARAGIEVETDAREVTVYRLELLEWNPPCLIIEVECSKGTYIRSIAHDIGQSLGCGAHISALIRTKYGPFNINDSVTLPQFEDAFKHEYWQELLYPMDIVINDWIAVIVTPEQERAILNGRTLPCSADNTETRCRAYSIDGRFLAILRSMTDKTIWQPEKVFHNE
jgi:tRNA pseudouridine55 synthase